MKEQGALGAVAVALLELCPAPRGPHPPVLISPQHSAHAALTHPSHERVPALCACSASAGTLTAVAGPRPTRAEEGVLFHWGKHNSHKRAEKAQTGL